MIQIRRREGGTTNYKAWEDLPTVLSMLLAGELEKVSFPLDQGRFIIRAPLVGPMRGGFETHGEFVAAMGSWEYWDPIKLGDLVEAARRAKP